MENYPNVSAPVEDSEICTPLNTLPIVNNEAANYWLHTNIQEVIYKVVLPIIVVLGLVGNGAFLFMVASLSRMKNTVNFFLVNLSIADIIFTST